MVDTLKIAPEVRDVLRATGTRGFLDTLIAIAGLQPPFIRGQSPRTPLSEIGSIEPLTGGIEIATKNISDTLFTETLAHEIVGHFVGLKVPERLPTIAAGHISRAIPYRTEPAAHAAARAVLGLRALARDTTNAEGILDLFERGQHPSLSEHERKFGRVLGTTRVVAELLGLPIFERHPLQPLRERLLREAQELDRR